MDLDAAIEHLYSTFSRYGVGRAVHGCPHCIDPKRGWDLAMAPLRRVPRELLRDYAVDSLWLWGTADDFKHFVPAIWERITKGDLGADPQTVYSKLPHAGWRSWPEVEQAAVVHVTAAWLEAILAGQSGWARIRDVIECAGLAGMDVSSLVARLDSAAGPTAASAIAELVKAHGGRWGWWKSDEERVLDHWVHRSAARKLEDAFFAYPDHPDAPAWSYAVEWLEASGISPP